MKIKSIKIDEARVKEVSFRNKEQGDRSCARAMAYLMDSEKEKRLKNQECSHCFYFCGGRLVGQAFTEWDCGVCGKLQMHSNTGTPKVCNDCAKEHTLCVSCGGDLHNRVNRPQSIK